MFASVLRSCMLGCLIWLPAAALAQEYILPYIKTPETPQECWAAVKYEVELGNHRRAAKMFDEFWKKLTAIPEANQGKLLLGLYDMDGLPIFLQIANVAEVRKVMAKDPATNKDVPAADLLISKINQVVTARLSDPKRIEFFVGNLAKSQEERDYALTQLRQAGARAVPHMMKVLEDTGRQREHNAIYTALLKMNRDIAPPILAALDSDKPFLQSTIISLFVARADNRIVPHLWFLHGQPGASDVKKQATAALAKFLKTVPEGLGDPRAALTREAERFYQQRAELSPGEQQTLWRWDAKSGLTSQTVTRSQFEEQEGVFWAKKAISLDPAFRPAQIVLLSLVLEKSYERGGVDKPLAKTDPALDQLLAGTGSGLLEAVLDRALAEGRTAAALGAARALGPVGDWRLVRPTEKGSPALLRALSYPDRRVQLAAAEAILRIPGVEGFSGSSRVIEVLRRALVAQAAPKVVIGYADRAESQKLSALLRQWGYEPVTALTGRDVMKLALDSADVELIFLDPRLPDPGLSFLLSQLRTGPEASGIPVVLMTTPEQARAVRTTAARYSRMLVLAPPPVSPELLKHELEPFMKDAFRVPLTEEERRLHTRIALDWLGRIARGEVSGYDLRPVEAAILQAATNDELAKEAVEILGHRSGRTPQIALADLALNSNRPAPVRTEAAKQLRLHIQRFGVLMKPAQTSGLVKMAAEVEDPALREESTRLAASLQVDAAIAGNRLRQFEPSTVKPQPAGVEKGSE